MSELKIRDAQLEDAARLVEIYSHYVLDTAVSFEYAVPSVEEFADRIKNIKTKFPYLVCEKDGKIIGYVYASSYSSRAAYDWTVSTSIYVDKDCRRNGAGALLYKELKKRLKEKGIINLLAGVAFCENEDEYLTHDSQKFHLKMGYSEVAHMKGVGKKFERWYDIKWFQKKI
ncbi:MAG: N-acetyltransferase [Treponema sp.]|nr:N-acetyltransferase [Treponema sp.]